MTPERRYNLALILTSVYAGSFLLPVGLPVCGGALAFLVTLIGGIGSSCALVTGASSHGLAYLIGWSANVFFVIGLRGFWHGNDSHAARWGGAAVVASLPMTRYEAEFLVHEGYPVLFGVLLTLGYLAWMLALLSLAVVATVVILTDEAGDFHHIQLRLRWIMIGVAVIALVLAEWPTIIWLLYGT